jgi:hypothetical protein
MGLFYSLDSKKAQLVGVKGALYSLVTWTKIRLKVVGEGKNIFSVTYSNF